MILLVIVHDDNNNVYLKSNLTLPDRFLFHSFELLNNDEISE